MADRDPIVVRLLALLGHGPDAWPQATVDSLLYSVEQVMESLRRQRNAQALELETYRRGADPRLADLHREADDLRRERDLLLEACCQQERCLVLCDVAWSAGKSPW